MNNKTTMRIIQDIYDFNQNKPDGIYLYIDKQNIIKQYALIIGPADTPYFGGFFFFEIDYPANYPQNPPVIKFLTTDGYVRFNPNLYENGKVCLSILGTWPGPKWSPVMNIRLVLDSIRSLLGVYPLHNEPGYDTLLPTNSKSIDYNKYVIYHTYRLAILEVLNNTFYNISSKFENEIKLEIEKNKVKLHNDLLSYEEIYTISTVSTSIVYFIKPDMLNYTTLLKKFSEKIEINI